MLGAGTLCMSGLQAGDIIDTFLQCITETEVAVCIPDDGWVSLLKKESGLLCTDDNGIKHRYNHTDTSCRDCTKGGYPGFRFISI